MIEEADGFILIETILKEVSAANGVKLRMTALPVAELLADYRGALSVNNELARDVLLRTLQGIDDRLTWLLYYDSLTKSYFFSRVVGADDRTTRSTAFASAW